MNRVVHFEVHAKDMDKVQKFYQELFGWDIKDMGAKFGGYRMVMTGENKPGEQWPGINGGMTPRMGAPAAQGAPVNAFVCTITVENIDAMIQKAKAAGGTVALDKMDVPSVGLLAYILDPENNIFGMLQPASQTT